jgi:hypothetical protein
VKRHGQLLVECLTFRDNLAIEEMDLPRGVEPTPSELTQTLRPQVGLLASHRCSVDNFAPAL